MAIKFLNVVLKDKNKTLIKDLNISFKEEIIGVYKDNLNIISKLFLDGKNLDNNKKIVYIDDLNKNTFLTKTISDEFFLVKKNMDNKIDYIAKIVSSLKMVGLSEDYLDREINTLSKSEKKLLQIAISLVTNPDVVIFKDSFLYLDNNNTLILKKIILNLKKKYQKTVLVIDNDINKLYELVDSLLIFKNNKLLIYDKVDLVFKDIEFLINNQIELPNNILFSKLASKYSYDIKNYKDIKDLIKEVYRNAQGHEE